MLTLDPHRRLTAEEALRHPYFKPLIDPLPNAVPNRIELSTLTTSRSKCRPTTFSPLNIGLDVCNDSPSDFAHAKAKSVRLTTYSPNKHITPKNPQLTLNPQKNVP